jgi:hypothetical protein
VRAGALGFNLSRRRAEMPLHRPVLAFLHPLVKNLTVLGVSLSQIPKSKSLSIVHLRRTVAVTFENLLDPPFDIGWWAFFTAAEELLKFDLELANVTLQARQVFVSLVRGHRWRRNSHAKRGR